MVATLPSTVNVVNVVNVVNGPKVIGRPRGDTRYLFILLRPGDVNFSSFYFVVFRPYPARAGSVASSTVSAAGSLSGDISDNVEDEEGDQSDYPRTQTPGDPTGGGVGPGSIGGGSEASAPGTPQLASWNNVHTPTHRASSDTEKRRRRPASVPLRKSLSQGGVPESDQVHLQRGGKIVCNYAFRKSLLNRIAFSNRKWKHLQPGKSGRGFISG